MGPMSNLRQLRDELSAKDWKLTSFKFNYKQTNYIVLVKLFDDGEVIPQYALVKLEFIDSADLDRFLETPANTWCLLIDAKTLRKFFGITYGENLGDILREFCTRLGDYIPQHISLPDSIEIPAVEASLQRRPDAEDPNKRYCFAARHNGKSPDGSQKLRTSYNSAITAIRRPRLYEILSPDKTISFCYTSDPSKERTDVEILASIE